MKLHEETGREVERGQIGECINNIFTPFSAWCNFKRVEKLDKVERGFLDKHQPSPAVDERIIICRQRRRRSGEERGGAFKSCGIEKRNVFM